MLITDGAGGEVLHTFTLDVLPTAPNTVPFNIHSPRAEASLLSRYVSRTGGTDSAGQALTTEIISGPDGLSLDSSGTIQWQPTTAQLGQHVFVVLFRSPSGSTEQHEFTLRVLQTIRNEAPQIVSTPPTYAVVDRMYQYDVQTVDTDNDSLHYDLLDAPDGMSIHPAIGACSRCIGRRA